MHVSENSLWKSEWSGGRGGDRGGVWKVVQRGLSHKECSGVGETSLGKENVEERRDEA